MDEVILAKARRRYRWSTALFWLTVALMALSPVYALMTVGGFYQALTAYPEMFCFLAVFSVLLPFVLLLALALDVKSLIVTGILLACGLVVARWLWRSKRALEEFIDREKRVE